MLWLTGELMREWASQRGSFTSRDRRSSTCSRVLLAVFNMKETRSGTVKHHRERMSRWLKTWFLSLTQLVAAHEVDPGGTFFRNRKLRHDKLFDGALRCSLETTMLIVYNCFLVFWFFSTHFVFFNIMQLFILSIPDVTFRSFFLVLIDLLNQIKCLLQNKIYLMTLKSLGCTQASLW